MSVDYFLVSPSHKKLVLVGCAKDGETFAYSGSEEARDFIRWAIESGVGDVHLMTEHDVENLGFQSIRNESVL